jgi:PPOX class probable F420-dependent enzyme
MQLSEAMRAFLAERRFAVLATIGEDGLPHQTVMWFELVGDEVLMNTARGRIKDKHIRRDARVSICIEDGYRYLTITGNVTLDDDQVTAQADIAQLARRYEGDSARTESMINNFRTQQRVTMRLRIENVVANGFSQ